MITLPKRRGSALQITVRSILLSLILLSIILPPWAEGSQVDVVTYDGVINPVAAEFLTKAIEIATEDHAEALIIQLDTPGGLDTSMRIIIKEISASAIPIVLYVSP